MNTWLLSWNADKWAWDDPLNGYEELINDISQVGHAYCKWTCGVNKSIKVGDRIFLIKLGSSPKGIVASGYAATEVFEGTHWDLSKRSNKKAKRIFVDFDKIRNYTKEDILLFCQLHEISSSFHWSIQCSGITIPEGICAPLETAWSDF
jgi:hypothetical protein